MRPKRPGSRKKKNVMHSVVGLDRPEVGFPSCCDPPGNWPASVICSWPQYSYAGRVTKKKEGLLSLLVPPRILQAPLLHSWPTSQPKPAAARGRGDSSITALIPTPAYTEAQN